MADVMQCPVCPSKELNSQYHKDSTEHRFYFAIYQYYEFRKKLLKDRHGVEINITPKLQNNLQLIFEHQRNKGKYIAKITAEQLLLHDNKIVFQCTIQNKRRDIIYVISANLLHPSDVFKMIYNKKIPFGSDKEYILGLEPGSSYTFHIQFSIEEITNSSFIIPVVCNFQTVDNESFTIPRSILVAITDSEEKNETKTKSPFTFKEWTNITQTIPPTQHMHYTNNYSIPQKYRQVLKFALEPFKSITEDDEAILNQIKNIIGGKLSETNYRDYWHIILWVEEIAQTLMLQKYNMENVSMSTKQSNILVLEVPGLAEKRPSVVIGDFIQIRVHEDHTVYKGIVKRVNDKTVDIYYVVEELVNYIKFNPNTQLDVAFTLNRLSFERMHEAVDKVACNMLPTIFPKPMIHNGARRNFQDFNFYNKELTHNTEQRIAVINIVNSINVSPYIVFGPPGTGKTITIVEAILQIKQKTSEKILVCAPSNSACDHIAIMLMAHCSKSELIRIHSDTRETSTLTEALKQYSNMEGVDMFKKLSVDEIMKFRIVVTTLTLIGRHRKYEPDCVFVDEAAQASEPETDIAIGYLKVGKQIVLAGDPKQLGPMVASRCAEKYGLGVSLLERLMEFDLYKPDPKTGHYDYTLITMLKLNFRSHADILKIPNEMFYNNSLTATSEKAQNDPVVKILIVREIAPYRQKRKKVFPGAAIEFCSISSKERREGSSPSYFNQEEVKTVLKCVRALTRLNLNDEHKVLLEHIGVITPYKRQVHKIKDILKFNGFEGIEVGTTESFQGREKRIIIISTVRAQHSLLLHDRKYNLGFVRHDKRFNVAVTRAISKLIIVGCQPVLSTDDKWSNLIKSCIENKTYFGAPYVERTETWKREVVIRMAHFKQQDDQFQRSS